MSLSDAIETAGRIVDYYPNLRASISDGFIGALAATLAAYPRQIALACAAPQGICAKAKFLSIAEVVAWCEHAVEPLWDRVVQERRRAEQIASRATTGRTEEMRRRVAAKIAEWEAYKHAVQERRSALDGARQQKDQAQRDARQSAIVREWNGESAPTIGGIPISRELHAMLTKVPAAE